MKFLLVLLLLLSIAVLSTLSSAALVIHTIAPGSDLTITSGSTAFPPFTSSDDLRIEGVMGYQNRITISGVTLGSLRIWATLQRGVTITISNVVATNGGIIVGPQRNYTRDCGPFPPVATSAANNLPITVSIEGCRTSKGSSTHSSGEIDTQLAGISVMPPAVCYRFPPIPGGANGERILPVTNVAMRYNTVLIPDFPQDDTRNVQMILFDVFSATPSPEDELDANYSHIESARLGTVVVSDNTGSFRGFKVADDAVKDKVLYGINIGVFFSWRFDVERLIIAPAASFPITSPRQWTIARNTITAHANNARGISIARFGTYKTANPFFDNTGVVLQLSITQNTISVFGSVLIFGMSLSFADPTSQGVVVHLALAGNSVDVDALGHWFSFDRGIFEPNRAISITNFLSSQSSIQLVRNRITTIDTHHIAIFLCNLDVPIHAPIILDGNSFYIQDRHRREDNRSRMPEQSTLFYYNWNAFVDRLEITNTYVHALGNERVNLNIDVFQSTYSHGGGSTGANGLGTFVFRNLTIHDRGRAWITVINLNETKSIGTLIIDQFNFFVEIRLLYILNCMGSDLPIGTIAVTNSNMRALGYFEVGQDDDVDTKCMLLNSRYAIARRVTLQDVTFSCSDFKSSNLVVMHQISELLLVERCRHVAHGQLGLWSWAVDGSPAGHGDLNLGEVIWRNNFINLSAGQSAQFISMGMFGPSRGNNPAVTNLLALIDPENQKDFSFNAPDLSQAFSSAQRNFSITLQHNEVHLRGGDSASLFLLVSIDVPRLNMIGDAYHVSLWTVEQGNNYKVVLPVPPQYRNIMESLPELKVVRALRFGIFGEHTHLRTIQLGAPPDSSVVSGAGNCPVFNDEKITTKLLEKHMSVPLEGMFDFLFGSGTMPRANWEANTSKCVYTPSLSRTKIPTATFTDNGTITVELTPPPTRTATQSSSIALLPTPDVDPPPGEKAAVAALTSIAAATALLAGPTAALDAGRTLAVLATLSRCQGFAEAELALEDPARDSDRMAREYARRYLSRTLEFPDSLIPSLCFGNTGHDGKTAQHEEGRCIRGAVVAGFIFLLMVFVAAMTFGFMMAKNQSALEHEQQQQQHHDRGRSLRRDSSSNRRHGKTTAAPPPPLPTPMEVLRRARLPFMLTQAVAIQLASWSSHAFALILASPVLFPGIAVVRDKVFLGGFVIFLCWLIPGCALAWFMQKFALSREYEATAEKERRRDQGARGRGRRTNNDNGDDDINSGDCSQALCSCCSREMTRADAFQLEPPIIWSAMDLDPEQQQHSSLEAVADSSPSEILLVSPRALSGTTFTPSPEKQRQLLLLQQQRRKQKQQQQNAAAASTGNNHSSRPAWQRKLLGFVRTSSFGRWLLTPEYCWSQGSTTRGEQITGGIPGSFLNQLGSVVNKFHGPLSLSAKQEQRRQQQRQQQGLGEDESSNGGGGGGSPCRSSCLAAARTRIAPFTVFINSVWVVLSALCQSIAALYPQSCQAVLSTLAGISLLCLLHSSVVGPFLLRPNVYLSIVSDTCVLIASVIATVAIFVISQGQNGSSASVEAMAPAVSAAKALLSISLVATNIKAFLSMFVRMLSASGIYSVVTEGHAKALTKQEQQNRAELKRQQEREQRGVAEISHALEDLMSPLSIHNSNSSRDSSNTNNNHHDVMNQEMQLLNVAVWRGGNGINNDDGEERERQRRRRGEPLFGGRQYHRSVPQQENHGQRQRQQQHVHQGADRALAEKFASAMRFLSL